MAVFHRAVSVEEYEDILATGKLRAGPISAEGKHLWLTVEHAREFRELLLMRKWESVCIIIVVEVSDDAAQRFARFQMMDGIGPACFAELADLEGAVVREVMQ